MGTSSNAEPAALMATLDAAADPEQAAVLTRFFQVRPGGYGEGDRFLGLKLSRVRQLVRPYRNQPFRPPDWQPLL